MIRPVPVYSMKIYEQICLGRIRDEAENAS